MLERVLKSDGPYRITENSNYAPGAGNVFLEYYKTGHGYICLGGADDNIDGTWRATITADYDPETDSDATCVVDNVSRDKAIEALWDKRHEAYIY